MRNQWFIIQTLSGQENKVKDSIEKRVKTEEMQDFIKEVMVPIEKVVEVRNQKKTVSNRKLWPGYVFVNMVLLDDENRIIEKPWYFIRETQGADWQIEVAAYPEYHPQQRYAARDLQFFADKMHAGANSAITQFFFNPDAYFHFVDEARKLGVTAPIVPGIMPFHNYARIAQFAARDGIEIPRWVALKMEGYMDDTASIRAFGLDVMQRVCERLIAGGVPGIHFYTLNQSALTLELCKRLKLG